MIKRARSLLSITAFSQTTLEPKFDVQTHQARVPHRSQGAAGDGELSVERLGQLHWVNDERSRGAQVEGVLKRFILAAAGLVVAAVAILPAIRAQQSIDMSHFEVVSVRINKVPPVDFVAPCSGGPGTESPTFWRCGFAVFGGLIRSAFGLEVYQYLQTEMNVDTYSISARLPANATKEQFREMQRNMLEERFGLKWHWREKDATVYRLVRDPAGVKLHESAPGANPAVVDYGLPPGTVIGKDRYPVLPEGVSGLVGMANHNRWRMSNVTTADIAWVLRYEFRTDVIDETGLTGHYDVDLRWETPPMEVLPPSAPPYGGPDAKTEFRNKLGLLIEPVKGKVKTFVVDHIDRVPAEN